MERQEEGGEEIERDEETSRGKREEIDGKDGETRRGKRGEREIG